MYNMQYYLKLRFAQHLFVEYISDPCSELKTVESIYSIRICNQRSCGVPIFVNDLYQVSCNRVKTLNFKIKVQKRNYTSDVLAKDHSSNFRQ